MTLLTSCVVTPGAEEEAVGVGVAVVVGEGVGVTRGLTTPLNADAGT